MAMSHDDLKEGMQQVAAGTESVPPPGGNISETGYFYLAQQINFVSQQLNRRDDRIIISILLAVGALSWRLG